MTPHELPLKIEVGVRELHNHLSRYVQHVAAGGEVLVTTRGRRVARLSSLVDADPLADLQARGLVRQPTQSKRPSGSHRTVMSSTAVSDLVSEQRR